MSKSIAQKKSAKKKRGERTYSRVREKTYARSRAPHALPAEANLPVASMLVRSQPFDLLRIESHDWHGENVQGPSDVFRATAIFACGCQVTREAVIRYADHEREKMLEEMALPSISREKISKIEALLFRRWLLKEDLLGDMQREYHSGLPVHEHEAA